MGWPFQWKITGSVLELPRSLALVHRQDIRPGTFLKLRNLPNTLGEITKFRQGVFGTRTYAGRTIA